MLGRGSKSWSSIYNHTLGSITSPPARHLPYTGSCRSPPSAEGFLPSLVGREGEREIGREMEDTTDREGAPWLWELLGVLLDTRTHAHMHTHNFAKLFWS